MDICITAGARALNGNVDHDLREDVLPGPQGHGECFGSIYLEPYHHSTPARVYSGGCSHDGENNRTALLPPPESLLLARLRK